MCLSSRYRMLLVSFVDQSVHFAGNHPPARGLKSGREKRTKIRPSPIILTPFVLQKGSAWFLSHVDWNRVDMHECESVLRGESNAECKMEIEREKCLIASLTPFMAYLCFSLLSSPVFTHTVRQAFHGFKERCRLQVSITSNKSCFFSHYAAWSGDRPFNIAL